MKKLFLLLLLCFSFAPEIHAQELTVPLTYGQQINYSSTPAHDPQYDVTLNSRIFRNAAFRGALLQATSYGAFMWLTDENVWLSAGLSVLTVATYSILDDPNNWDAHLGHVGTATLLSVGISIPLADKKKRMPWRILNN